ncbi:MAG: MMPL family transporter [Deltaproteobacteria bacterium]|nr:MAG: MMPL family transporter [Deltaproteobacteria bacterium]
MIQGMDEFLGRSAARWVDVTRRSAAAVVALFLVISAGTLFYVAQGLGVHGGTEEMFSAELPFRKDWDAFRRAFPDVFDPIYVVVEADTASRAREAAELLARRLDRQPELFEAIYLPGHGTFFERHGLLYLEPEELLDLADHLAEVQPYLAELARDPTLRGLFDLLATGLDAAGEGDSTVIELAPVLDRIRDAIDAVLADRPQPLSWEPVILGDAPTGGDFRVLIVSPVFDYSDITPGRAPMQGVRRAIEELGLDARANVRVRVTGDIALEAEEMELVGRDAAQAGAISFALVTLILFAALRSPWLVLSTVVTLLCGLVLTAGFAALAIGYLNPVSVAFAVLFIGLSVDFAIHLGIRYREAVGRGEAHAEALRSTATSVGASLVICAVTTAIGFFAFVPTDYRGVAELGLIAGTGMLISLICNLTLLPALVSLRPLPEGTRPAGRLRPFIEAFAAVPARRARLVGLGALLLGIGAIALLPRVSFDYNPLTLRVQDSESVTAYYDLLEHGGESPWQMSVLAPDLRVADAVAARLRGLEAVERAVTLSDYVPDRQAEKLEILSDIALFLGPIAPAEVSRDGRGIGPQKQALRAFANAVERLEGTEADPELIASARRLARQVERVEARLAAGARGAALIAELESNLLGDLPDGLRRLEAALGATRVEVDDLPRELVASSVADDGRVRVQVFPREDLSDDAALRRFVESVRGVIPNATGLAVVILESGRSVVRSFREALVSASAVIALLLVLLWRRIPDAALVMAPLFLAAAFTSAATVVLGIPLNFADVIVIPLLLGMGVDSGIHLVHRHRIEHLAGGGLLASSTARAVLYSALTTIASFGSLALSVHPGMRSMGMLLSVGIVLMLACNLVVLPALIELSRRRSAAR